MSNVIYNQYLGYFYRKNTIIFQPDNSVFIPGEKEGGARWRDRASPSPLSIGSLIYLPGIEIKEHAAGEHSAGEHSAGEHSAGEHSAKEHSAKEHSAGEHSAGEHSAREHSAGEHSVGEHSAREHSAREHSAGEHSAREHSAREHSAGEHSSSKNPLSLIIICNQFIICNRSVNPALAFSDIGI
uniref:Uncharacterized protein n=1 Tax=Salmo trutta TaxID=8032 RepID=A0A673W840_SALTR